MAEHPRRLLVLDTSYSLETLRANQQEASVTCRDLGGYFDHVWTAHPFASLVTSEAWSARCGPPVEFRVSSRHTFIEGKIGHFGLPGPLAALDLLVAQGGILHRLVRLVREQNISVVRAGDPLAMGLYAWAIARWCGIPFLVRLAANYERLRQQTGRPMMPRLGRSVIIERAVERFVLARADVVAAVNEDNRQYAIGMGVCPDRTTVFRYGNLVDPRHFADPHTRPAGRALLEELQPALTRNPFLLCIGRLEPAKMPDHAVRVLATLRADGLNPWLLMVGDGRMRLHLKALADQLGVGEQVIFAGARDQEWLAQIIPHASVALSPLTGRALSEVALGGAPTVAYDADWQGELIRPWQTGALVPNRDVNAMAAAAAMFLRDPLLARRMGDQLRRASLDMMDPGRLDAHERGVYDRLFARFATGARRRVHA